VLLVSKIKRRYRKPENLIRKNPSYSESGKWNRILKKEAIAKENKKDKTGRNL
jgi:hypothetical protein